MVNLQGPIPRGDLVPSGIVGLLGTQGPTARTDIARALGLSPATVTQVTKDLIARGLIEELESVPSKGGRPSRLLGLLRDAGVALGAKVTADHVAVVTVELDGTVRSSTEHAYDPSTPDAIERLGQLLAKEVAGLDDRLLGVGVGVPGAVDSQASGVVDAPTLGWQSAQVGPVLRTAIGTPVLVDNDVNTLAAAERLYGIGRDHSSYLVVTIGRGIGCSIVVDGAIYRGANGGAGEIGHIPVWPSAGAAGGARGRGHLPLPLRRARRRRAALHLWVYRVPGGPYRQRRVAADRSGSGCDRASGDGARLCCGQQVVAMLPRGRSFTRRAGCSGGRWLG